MARGTFAKVRIVSNMVDKVGPMSKHIPSGEVVPIYEAVAKYMDAGKQTQEIGVPRDQSIKESKQSSLRATRECIDQTCLVWVSSHSNSRMVKELRNTV